MILHGIDPELLSEFIDESVDALGALDSLFVGLEQSSGDMDIVNAIFRPIHSLKGNAAFFGLLKVKDLAHCMENVLDKMRKGKIVNFRAAIDALLPGLDILRMQLASVRDGADELPDPDVYAEVLKCIVLVAEGNNNPASADGMQSVLSKLIALHTVLPDKQKPFAADAIAELKHVMGLEVHADTNYGTEIAGAIPLELQSLVIALENSQINIPDELALDAIRHRLTGLLEAAVIGSLAHEHLKSAIESFDTFMGSMGFDPLMIEIILEKTQSLRDPLFWDGHKSIPASSSESVLPKTEIPGSSTGVSSEKTMRVSEHSVDAFLSCVEELIVVEEMFNFAHKNLSNQHSDANLLRELRRTIETFGALSTTLQNGILAIRKVPIRNLLQKAPRIVRDTASQAGKEVEYCVHGDDLLIDKSYIDLLDAPLTHIVRNAVDHGIESPGDRLKAGKLRTGHVTIDVYELETDIVISFSDDGKGLDYEKLIEKAVSIGIIAQGRNLTADETVELLFLPGVSTALAVTDISGRGVGMDVARRNIEAAGGRIAVESIVASGTKFSVFLPKSISTRIIDGFLVSAGGSVYALPMELISESFAAADNEISTVAGHAARMVLRRGDLLPLVDLQHSLTGYGSVHEIAGHITVVACDLKGVKYALAVDHIVGVQKVVVKPLDGAMVEKDLFEGAAMMGDGSVAMIIGSKGICKFFE